MRPWCAREADVLDAVASGRWPDRLDADLAAHLDACEACRDTAVVAHAVAVDRDAARSEAMVPSSAQVWWRASMRAREEAMRTAERPIALAHIAAAGLVVALVAGFAWSVGPSMVDRLSQLREAAGAGPIQSVVLAAIGLLAVVMSIVLCAMFVEE